MVEKVKEEMDPLEMAAAELASPVQTPASSRSTGALVDPEHEGEFSIDLGAAGHQIAEDTLAAVQGALRIATLEQKQRLASASEEVQADGTATTGDDVGNSKSKLALVGQLQTGDADADYVQEAMNMLQAEMRNSGFSEEQIEDDADIQYLQGRLQDLGEPTFGDKVTRWDLPQSHQTRKASKTEWFHRKYQRRKGLLGPHYLNKLEGKSGTKKKKLMKEFILAKRKALKQRKQRGEPSYAVDELLPKTEFDDA